MERAEEREEGVELQEEVAWWEEERAEREAEWDEEGVDW